MLHRFAAFIKKMFCAEPVTKQFAILREALSDLEVAQNHFENCEPEFVAAAIFELNAAESRVAAARRVLV